MGFQETSDLPMAVGPAKNARGGAWWRVVVALAAAGTLFWLHVRPLTLQLEDADYLDDLNHRHALEGCEQVPPLDLQLGDLGGLYSSDSFRNLSINRLGGIVRIESMSYDDMGTVEDDDRFKVFFKIEEYLERTFPAVHKHLKKENVNTHGLLYTWEGSDKSLKPSILMAHQDTVPVEKSTIDDWTHPPFSGYYDGTYIWGRGASDCKSQLTAILESVETLLNADYSPKRTLVLSFGFDEEISGTRGAGKLAERITEIYGEDSIAAIVDEGAGILTNFGATFAAPAVGEKGYTDVHITVRKDGGHSSIPPDHTSIGILSELITKIEADTYQPWLADENPILETLQCNARYAPEFPKKLKHLLADRQKHKHKRGHNVSPNTIKKCQRSKHADALAQEAAKINLATRYTMQTSQAVDVIVGGAKSNALPEKVEVVVNHRINIGETTKVVHKRITHLATKVAKHHNLTLVAFPKDEDKHQGNSMTLTSSTTDLEPAPVTPLDIFIPGTTKLSPWGVLSATTRGLYGEELKMSPAISTGNTDTRYMWNLSKHIFRYNPGYDPTDTQTGLGNIHTVNERQNVDAHINAIKWFTGWIKNIDQAEFE